MCVWLPSHCHNIFFIPNHSSSYLLCAMLAFSLFHNTPRKLDLRAFVLYSRLPESFLASYMHGCSFTASFRLLSVILLKTLSPNFLHPPTFTLPFALFNFSLLNCLPPDMYMLIWWLLTHIECKLSEGRDLYCCRSGFRIVSGSVEIWWISE